MVSSSEACPNYVLRPFPNKPLITSWEDVVRADCTRDSMTVIRGIVRFLRDHPDESFRTVEVRLRRERRYTYLVAQESKDLPKNVKVLDLKGNQCPYDIFITTRDKEIALIEKFQLVPNSQLNLERLEKCGGRHAMPADYMKYLAKVGGTLEVTRKFVDDLRDQPKN